MIQKLFRPFSLGIKLKVVQNVIRMSEYQKKKNRIAKIIVLESSHPHLVVVVLYDRTASLLPQSLDV